MFGQATIEPVTAINLMTVVGPLGIAGVLVWYLYYRTTVTDPKTAELHREERERALKDFRETLDKIVERFDKSLNSEREHREREAHQNREHFKCPMIHKPMSQA